MPKPPERDIKEPANKKNELGENKTLILNTIITAVLLLIFTVVIFTLFNGAMNKKFENLQKTQQEANVDDTVMDTSNEQGIVLDLGDFILNLSDTNPRRFLKVNVAIELSKTVDDINQEQDKKKKSGHGESEDPTAKVVSEMDQYKPAIRDAVITVLTGKTSDELSTATGKELAKEEIQDSVDSIFNGARSVLRVSFGQFIIQ